MSSEELKPCPFCGSNVEFHQDDECSGCHYIHCHSCKAFFDFATSVDPKNTCESVNALRALIAPIWNRRALLSEQPQADVQCGCGDCYPADSFGAGFIAATGQCPNCDAADDAAKQPQASAAQSAAPEGLRDAVNALLHQIDIGDFVDSRGYSAKMLKPVHDLMRMLAAPAQPAAHDHGEVQRLREALEKFEPYLGEKVHYASDAADDCRYWRLELFIRTPARNPEPFDVAAEKWIRAALAASTSHQQQKGES